MSSQVIICGGWHFQDYDLLEREVSRFILKLAGIEIISGGARGADQLGERFASENNLPLRVFPADWDRYGRAAGSIRNREMVRVATHVIAFWDGESRGTGHMIRLAEAHGLEVHVVRYGG